MLDSDESSGANFNSDIAGRRRGCGDGRGSAQKEIQEEDTRYDKHCGDAKSME